jgi:hypothetical protein
MKLHRGATSATYFGIVFNRSADKIGRSGTAAAYGGAVRSRGTDRLVHHFRRAWRARERVNHVSSGKFEGAPASGPSTIATLDLNRSRPIGLNRPSPRRTTMLHQSDGNIAFPARLAGRSSVASSCP